MRRMRVPTALLTLFFISACATVGPGPTPSTEHALIRVVTGAQADPAVTVAIDNQTVDRAPGSQATAGAADSGYFEVLAGERHIEVHDGDALLIDQRVTVEAGGRYTLLVRADGQDALVLTDEPDQEGDIVRVRVIHNAPAAGPVDVYVTAPGEALADATPVLPDFQVEAVTDFLELPAGVYRVRITPAGESTLAYDSGPLPLEGGQSLTLVAQENPDGDPFPVTLVVLTGRDVLTLPGVVLCVPLGNTTPQTAAVLEPGTLLVELCVDEDDDAVAFYRFSLTDTARVELDVAAASLGSALTPLVILYDADEEIIDADLAGDARIDILLGEGEYIVSVEDVAGGSGDGFLFELSYAADRTVTPTFAATVGTFTSASNNPTVVPGIAAYLAVSATDDDGDTVPYKIPVTLAIDGEEIGDFLFDPALTFRGILSALLVDTRLFDAIPLASAAERAEALRSGISTQALTPEIDGPLQLALPLAVTPLQDDLTVDITFTTVLGSLERTLDPEGFILPAPVTDIAISGNRRNVTVFFDPADGASRYRATVFGRESAVTGNATGSQSPLVAALSAPLSVDEDFAAQVQAGDIGLLELPLPDDSLNLSEYLYYSEFPFEGDE